MPLEFIVYSNNTREETGHLLPWPFFYAQIGKNHYQEKILS